VTVAQFNIYCQDTGACLARPGRGKVLITGIASTEAQNYARWLSKKTQFTYRLPTDAEWQYAASADGSQPRKNFNCTAKLRAKVIKGQDLINARSGDASGWGLTNYVGNAQEWVRNGTGVTARGGAHIDALSKCDVTLSRPHGGGPDAVTGFRLVRELK
jgi:formylglycine-generating enzyme required for sulfatase activity